MSFEKELLTKIPIWAQFYNVPLEYWTAQGLSYIASSIGRPLYSDSLTESLKRISYARVCIEVDSKLLLSFDLQFANGEFCEVMISYPWKPGCRSLVMMRLIVRMGTSMFNLKYKSNGWSRVGVGLNQRN